MKWRNRLISLMIIVVVWEVLGRSMNSLLMPTCGETVVALAGLLAGSELWRALWVSNQALLAGYIAALSVGLGAGMAMGLARPLGRLGSVYLTILLTVPTSAIIPLILIAFGLNLSARVIVVFLFAFPIIAFNTQAGLREVDVSLLEMARSFGASRWQTVRFTLVPAALPGIIVGARVGLGRAIAGMVVVELLLIAVGLGRLLVTYQARFEAGHVYAVILVVLFEAVLLMKMAQRVERRMLSWKPST